MFTKYPLTILGLAGGAGVGKDTLADKYLRREGFLPMALADEIKIRLIASGACTFEEAFVTKPPHIRTLMQQEGTERGRDVYGESYWFDCMVAKATVLAARWGETFTRIVVPDVRFPNEVELIQKAGGKVFRIEAPGRYADNGMSPEARLHRSERSLDGYTGYDAVVLNDYEHQATVGDMLRKTLVAQGLVPDAAGLSAVRFGCAPVFVNGSGHVH